MPEVKKRLSLKLQRRVLVVEDGSNLSGSGGSLGCNSNGEKTDVSSSERSNLSSHVRAKGTTFARREEEVLELDICSQQVCSYEGNTTIVAEKQDEVMNLVPRHAESLGTRGEIGFLARGICFEECRPSVGNLDQHSHRDSRDDSFIQEDTDCAKDDVLPLWSTTGLGSQAAVGTGDKLKSSELSFRESFYSDGTDWSCLYVVDDYGLPCSPASSGNRFPVKVSDSGLSFRGDLQREREEAENSSFALEPRASTSTSIGFQKVVKGSSVARCATKLKQGDLSEFLGLKRKPSAQKILSVKKPGHQDILDYFGLPRLVKQPAVATEFIGKFQRRDSSPASTSSKRGQRQGRGGWPSEERDGDEPRAVRSCPFYKKIPGTSFTVDAFRYGAVEGCTAYFLSHFHSDHYGGLTRKWSHGPIFCTPVTAHLVAMCLYVDRQWLHPLPLGVMQMIGGVEVQFLEANHCPGAALILFRLPGGQRVLHTGDFRACKGMQCYPELIGARIFSLYLDTTYCNPKYKFPLQEAVIDFVIRVTRATRARNSKTLVVVGAYSIGKERVYLGIAEALGMQIYADHRRGRVLKSLDWPALSDRLCMDASSSALHVLPISSLNAQKLRAYLQSFHPQYTAVLGFRPTGWTYSEKIGGHLEQLKPQCTGPVTIYGVPYSEHSSFTELQEFVQFIRPQKIIPTVNIGSAAQREQMQSFFRQWLGS